jgi:hypothetical protein
VRLAIVRCNAESILDMNAKGHICQLKPQFGWKDFATELPRIVLGSAPLRE